MRGLLPERDVNRTIEYDIGKTARRYTGIAASIGEAIDSLLKEKNPRIPIGSIRGIQKLFDNAQNHLIESRRRKNYDM